MPPMRRLSAIETPTPLARLARWTGSLLLASALSAQGPALIPAPGQSVPAIDWSCSVATMRSEVLGETFRIYVARPPSFGHGERTFPVLYLLDGQYTFSEVLSDVASLVSTGQIPELLLVGIESRDRRRDFTPRGIVLPDVGDEARADRTLDFLEKELVPAVERDLRGGSPRVLLGHSHAGVLVLHALATRPAVFPWGIDLDTPVHLGDGFLAKGLERCLRDPATPPVRLVSFARVFGWSDDQWASVTARARPNDLLRRNRIDDETHETLVFAATYRALKQLFGDYSALSARELSGLEVEQRYRALGPLYGLGGKTAEVLPPESLLRRLVEDLLMEGHGAGAGEWLGRYVRAYGPPPDLARLEKLVDEVTALGEPSESVAGLLALPRATPEEMRAHLGTWSGSTWHDENGPRNPFRARFWVEDGAVRGEVGLEQGPPMAVEYLRVAADGTLEFGYKNGMRPRGLIVYDESPRKDTARPVDRLEGVMGFRGIRFRPLQDFPMPTVYFELVRTKAAAD